MKFFHTIIIGAGPGGLSCAASLSKQGYDVLVVDRKNTIGPKVCAGGIPSQALSDINIPPELIEESFPCQYVETPWQKIIIKYSTPVISTVNRKNFGQWMLSNAVNNGAAITTGNTVTSITPSHIDTKEGRIGYKYLVGADGSSSMVRRYLKLPSEKLGVGLHYQVPTQYSKMEWHLNPNQFNSGYVWIFPHRNSTSVGIYADRQDLKPGLLRERLLLWANRQGIDIANSRPQASLINFDFRGWHFKNIFLVGDAAGLASGFTGEGIYSAIVSGETVASTIMNKQFIPQRLNRIVARQKLHNRIQKFFCGNKVICQISMEMLVLALRLKLLNFKILELY